jgi:hypothetical protein
MNVEKATLAPFFDKTDLDNARLHIGTIPGWVSHWVEGITLENDIYFRRRDLTFTNIEEMAFLAHEMQHVVQFRKGMTRVDYIWTSIIHGYEDNPYEIEARQKEDQVRDWLRSVQRCLSWLIENL